MRRREFVSSFACAVSGSTFWTLASIAERRQPVVGFLSARSPEESAHLLTAFRRGLAEEGLVEGEHVRVEYRWANGNYDVLPIQAADLARDAVAVLVTVGGDMTARAAMSATQNIPIVAVFIADPVESGLVRSLNRPDGNVTGISNLNAVIESKRLSLLRELVPQASIIAALQNPDSPTAASQQSDIEMAARSMGLKVQFWKASTDRELDRAFADMAERHIPALYIGADAFFAVSREKLADLAARYRIPVVAGCPSCGRTDELRRRPSRHVSSCWQLCGTHSQGTQAVGAADRPIDQISVRAQSKDCSRARTHRAARCNLHHR